MVRNYWQINKVLIIHWNVYERMCLQPRLIYIPWATVPIVADVAHKNFMSGLDYQFARYIERALQDKSVILKLVLTISPDYGVIITASTGVGSLLWTLWNSSKMPPFSNLKHFKCPFSPSFVRLLDEICCADQQRVFTCIFLCNTFKLTYWAHFHLAIGLG